MALPEDIQDYVGHRIELINSHTMVAKTGATAVITGASNKRASWVNIRWEQNELSGAQQNGSYEKNIFEMIGLPKPPEPLTIKSRFDEIMNETE